MDQIILSIVAKIGEYTVAPIGRQVCYPFRYNINIKDLTQRRQELVNVREDVQDQVDEATNQGRKIKSVVSTWMKRVDDAIIELPSNMSQHNYPSCFNIVQRYQGSRKAKKKEKEFSEFIMQKEKFVSVGFLMPLTGIGSSNMPENYHFLESRTSMAKQIKDALANSDFSRIGLFGMGGVGKTTILDEVEKLVLEEGLFDQVIKVIVGQSLSVEDIQAQMGDKLRLELRTAESKQGRADLLRNKLLVGNKILVMLDDLWNEVDLVDVGIPCTSKLSEKGSKILITSRKRNVLTKNMDVQKCFQLTHLNEEESWKFFSEIVGGFDRDDIEDVAKLIAKECGGLPLAIVAVGKTLKGEKLEIWKDALNQLKNPIAEKIEGVTDILYSSIKLSYDRIKSTEARLLFLLCSIFPDDYEILVEDLQRYAMGMRLLNEVNTWDEARNRVIKLVDDLISSSLLLESRWRDKCVQMHDVVRDVAIHIASTKEANMSALSYGYKHTEWPEKDRCGSFRAIFGNLENFCNLPQNLEFRNLELLRLQGSWYYTHQLQISNTFFKGIEKLTVLDLSQMCFQELRVSLTRTLIENLQVFCMTSCQVKNIDIIGELEKLQILRIQDCGIKHLPATMSKLRNLKVLKVTFCRKLVIPTNILSSMTKLEELDLSFSIQRWGEEVLYENKLVKNASLSELNFLPHLMSLKLDILDGRALQDLLFLENLKLKNFSFDVGRLSRPMCFESEFSRTLQFKIKSEADLVDRVFGKKWKICEDLRIEAVDKFVNLRFKSSENGHPSLSDENPESDIAFFDKEVEFPDLKKLTMVGGNNLKMVWHDHGVNASSFCKLQTIYISKFNSVRYILSSNIVMTLVFLTSLKIEDCELLETIFEMEEPTCKQKDEAKVMSSLRELSLILLPNLKHVWNKDPCAFLTFPNLEDIKIHECHQLQSVFPASFVNHVQKLESLIFTNPSKGVPVDLFSGDKTSKILLTREIVFPALKVLEVDGMMNNIWFRFARFPRLEHLRLNYYNNGDIIALPREISKIVYNLGHLHLRYVSGLVQIFTNEEEENNHSQIRSCGNLKFLSLDSLPELKHVWTDDDTGVNLKCDNLEDLNVKKCGKLKCLAPPSITFLNLRTLTVDGCHKLMNLVSSSMVESVVEIRVYDCREMTCIFAREEEEDEDKHAIVFTKLKYLIIERLPRLASFYSGKCKLVFPCLEWLSVNECPTMKMFSHGTISTPKLKRLQMNGSEIVPPTKDDINEIFHDN